MIVLGIETSCDETATALVDIESRRIVASAVLAEQVQQLRARGFSQFHFYTLNQANLTYAACRIMGLRPKDLS